MRHSSSFHIRGINKPFWRSTIGQSIVQFIFILLFKFTSCSFKSYQFPLLRRQALQAVRLTRLLTNKKTKREGQKRKVFSHCSQAIGVKEQAIGLMCSKHIQTASARRRCLASATDGS